MSGVNKVIIVGNCGDDPTVRYSSNGAAIANISVATSESWKDKNSGERQERTEWHRIVLFNRLGEIAGEYLKKGSKVYIEGKLQTRKWQDQQGQDRYTTEIVADQMQMLDGRDGVAGGGTFGMQSNGSQTGSQGQQQSQAQQSNGGQMNQNQGQQPPANDFSGDIPF